MVLPTKHILHIVLQYLSFTVAYLKSSFWKIYALHKVFFQPELEKGWLFSFLFPYIDSNWFSALLFVEWYDSSASIASASLAALNPSAGVITLVSRMMTFALSSQKGLPTHSNDPMACLIPDKSLWCWISSMILRRTRLRCQMLALKFIQHADHFRPCKHSVP